MPKNASEKPKRKHLHLAGSDIKSEIHKKDVDNHVSQKDLDEISSEIKVLLSDAKRQKEKKESLEEETKENTDKINKITDFIDNFDIETIRKKKDLKKDHDLLDACVFVCVCVSECHMLLCTLAKTLID